MSDPSPGPAPEGAGQVTTVVERHVRPDRIEAYEDWLKRLLHEAARLDGFLGAEIHRPSFGSKPTVYTSVFRFESLASLRDFEAGELRSRYLREVTDLVEADAAWDTHTGLELWFSAPPGTVVPQPVRWRMALLLGVVVYVLVLVFGALAGLLIPGLPYPLRLAIVITVEITVMTYFLLPFLTRRLAPWIYPRSAPVKS